MIHWTWRTNLTLGSLSAPALALFVAAPALDSVVRGIVLAAVSAGPVVGWLRFGYAGRVGAIVAAILFAWQMAASIGFAAAGDLRTSFVVLDVMVIYSAGVLVGWLLALVAWPYAKRQRHRTGFQPTVQPAGRATNWKNTTAGLALTLFGLVGTCGSGLAAISSGLGAYDGGYVAMPGLAELRLPTGVGVAGTGEGECGATAAFCSTRFTLTGSGPAETTVQEVRAYWESFGWRAEAPCAIKGLFGRVETCWYVFSLDGEAVATIEHAGATPWYPLETPGTGGPG